MKKKKILFVNSSLSSGGSERVMTLLANEFATKNEYDITMVLVREKENDVYELNDKVKCIRFYYNTKNKVIIFLKRIVKLRNLIKEEKYDYVISFMYDINLTTLISSLGLKIPIIVSERANPEIRKKRKIYNFIEHKMYLKAKNIVFQTKQVKEMYPLDIQEKAVIIPNPVNVNLPNRESEKIEKNIIAAGRLKEQKNFEMLIKAFAKFHEMYKEYKLIICGRGRLEDSLKKITDSLNIKNYVEFPGFVKNVNEKMCQASIYVSSSNFEGISNSMVEALAMGVPTICTDCPVGGAAMMIKNNENGILIPVGDVEALYNAMIKIVSDAEFAEKISRNAMKIREKYSIEKIVEMWETIL